MAENAEALFGGALVRGSRFAAELGVACAPVHLLVGAVEAGGPAAMLTARAESLRQIVARGGIRLHADGARTLTRQAQGAARALVERHGGPSRPQHLLVALLDQGHPSALTALGEADVDASVVRAAALADLGLPTDLPRLPMPRLAPAGTLDRPPLPIEELDPAVWAVLVWRQHYLPLRRLHSRAAWAAVCAVEERATWLLCDRRGVDEDQRYSLLHHHRRAVEHHLAAVRGDLTLTTPGRPESGHLIAVRVHPTRRAVRRRVRSFTGGWAAWFGNRRVGAHRRWIWLTTLHRYRHAPGIEGR